MILDRPSPSSLRPACHGSTVNQGVHRVSVSAGAVLQPPQHCWLVCEFLPGGTLSQWLYGTRGDPRCAMTGSGRLYGCRAQSFIAPRFAVRCFVHKCAAMRSQYMVVTAYKQLTICRMCRCTFSMSFSPTSAKKGVSERMGRPRCRAQGSSWGRPRLSLEARCVMGLEVARGMQALEESVPPILHRDLKPTNIFVGARGGLGLANLCTLPDFKIRAAADIDLP